MHSLDFCQVEAQELLIILIIQTLEWGSVVKQKVHSSGLKDIRVSWLPAWRLWNLWVTQGLPVSVGDTDLKVVLKLQSPFSKSLLSLQARRFFSIRFLGLKCSQERAF